jgi:hypothetical protein
MKRSSTLALVTTVCLFAIGVPIASALGASILLPLWQVRLSGKTSPLRISKRTPKPITLTLEGTISNSEAPEEPSPALKSLSLQFDRGGAIFTKGLATCRPPELSVPDIGWGARCPEALVGRGDADFEIDVPEEPSFRTEAPMEIFNGAPENGHPVLIYKVVAHVPATVTYITSAAIEKGHGRFGTQTKIPIPSIVRGEGSLIGFRAQIGKAWTYKGRKVSLLSARCPKGSLVANAEFDFVNGNTALGGLEQKCG